MNYTIKVYKNNKRVQMYRTHKIRRFLKNIRLIKFEDGGINAYIKVGYGKHIDVYGKITDFHNDGVYDNKEDFWWAFNAFIEK